MSDKNQKSNLQMSEALVTALFLTMSGGFQDAYTYCLRGGVFANAQTGNIVLMTSYLFQGKLNKTLHYLVPLCAFASGIFIAEVIQRRYKQIEKIHWRQLVLILEIVLLFIVGFIPDKLNIIANSMVSLVCAMQVQSFRKVRGNSYASTMCIGNIRSGTEALCTYCYTGDQSALVVLSEYLAIILTFAIGAGIGSVLTNIFNIRAIWFSCILLAVSFCMMLKTPRSAD